MLSLNNGPSQEAVFRVFAFSDFMRKRRGGCTFAGCWGLNIYCEATSKPSGWKDNWNDKGGTVYWYSETEQAGYWHYVSGVPTLW